MHTEYEKHYINSIPLANGHTEGDQLQLGTKRKRLNGTPRKRQEDIPWTAVRCNRLLRTITSRIQILRRLSENNFADKAIARNSPAKRKPILTERERKISPNTVDCLRSKFAALPALDSPTKADDPEWLPQEGKKSTSRTYGAKSKGSKAKSEEPPQRKDVGPGFRSPFIRQILRSEATRSPSNGGNADFGPQTPSRRKQSRITLQPNSHAERALRTLLDAFETLLITTAPPVPAARKGANSLRDACLRRMPAYIDLEQHFAYEVDEDYDFDATESVYVDLEKLGTNGWTGLREVTRAHAVKHIADAMHERTWPLETLDALLDICKRNDAIREGQSILHAWCMRSDGRVLNRFARLVSCSVAQDWYGSLFRTMRNLLEHGRLHICEFYEYPRVWQELLKALARCSTRADAVAFFESYAYLLIRQNLGPVVNGTSPVRKRDEHLHNVLVLATALCRTSEEIESEHCSSSLVSQMHRLAITIYQGSLQFNGTGHLGEEGQNPHVQHEFEPFAISSLILHAMNVEFSSDRSNELLTVDSLLEIFGEKEEQERPLSSPRRVAIERAEFVRDVAKCTAHINKEAAQGLIRDVTTGLLQLSKRATGSTTAFLETFAIDIASVWAEYSGDNDSYTFAEDIEKAAFTGSPHGSTIHSPKSCNKPAKFRWEDGLCEWIQATPLAVTSHQTPLRGRVNLGKG